ncbi:MAG: cyclodeaminase/cyclohydrolase family protein [Phycisphaerae bacterium]
MTESNADMLDMTVREFVAAVAADRPTPGGGSVAGVVGMLSAALGQMALNFTRGKKKYARHAEVHDRIARRLLTTGTLFQQLTDDDAEAFGFYQQAGDDEEAQLALSVAINVPREMTKLSLAMMDDLQELASKCNPWLLSDLMGAAALAATTVRLCDHCVAINCGQLADHTSADEIRTASTADVHRANVLLDAIEHTAAKAMDKRG